MTEPTARDPLAFVVEDSFHIRDRGIVLAPAFEPDRLPHGTKLIVQIAGPDGERTVHGAFFTSHLRLVGGASRWEGTVVLEESAGPIEPGFRVTCTVASVGL